VRRLIRHLQEESVVRILRRSRSDRGVARISEEWQAFIVKTHRNGNRGSRQMSPARVAVWVRVQELGTDRCPNWVYRVLKPELEK
jgi:putative transposase